MPAATEPQRRHFAAFTTPAWVTCRERLRSLTSCGSTTTVSWVDHRDLSWKPKLGELSFWKHFRLRGSHACSDGCELCLRPTLPILPKHSSQPVDIPPSRKRQPHPESAAPDCRRRASSMRCRYS